MEYRTTPLTVNELDMLRTLLESISARLLTSHGHQLTEAAYGETLTPENSFTLDVGKELAEIQRIRLILRLPPEIPWRSLVSHS
jgi:hypothetical protein